MLDIASNKVAHVIIKARECDAPKWAVGTLGIPLLADYLEEGLERLGISVEDAEKDVL